MLNEPRKNDIQVSLIFTIVTKKCFERVEGEIRRIGITTQRNEETGGAWWAPLCQGLRPGWPFCEKKSSFYHVVPATLDTAWNDGTFTISFLATVNAVCDAEHIYNFIYNVKKTLALVAARFNGRGCFHRSVERENHL